MVVDGARTGPAFFPPMGQLSDRIGMDWYTSLP